MSLTTFTVLWDTSSRELGLVVRPLDHFTGKPVEATLEVTLSPSAVEPVTGPSRSARQADGTYRFLGPISGVQTITVRDPDGRWTFHDAPPTRDPSATDPLSPEAIDAWPTPAWSPPAGLTVLRVRVETTAGAHAAVSGAVVVLHAPGGASTRRAITDDDGECVYVLTGVPTLDGDGNVSLEAEVSGAAASVDAVRVAPTTTFTAGDALAVRPSTTSRVVLRVT